MPYSFNGLCLDNKSICFADSVVHSGEAEMLAIAVGECSTAATQVRANEAEEEENDEHDLDDKHSNILQIMFCVLIMICTLTLVHCSMSYNIYWEQSISIAIIMFVYGFPYVLSIPAIWEIALRNSKRNYERYGNIIV